MFTVVQQLRTHPNLKSKHSQLKYISCAQPCTMTKKVMKVMKANKGIKVTKAMKVAQAMKAMKAKKAAIAMKAMKAMKTTKGIKAMKIVKAMPINARKCATDAQHERYFDDQAAYM